MTVAQAALTVTANNAAKTYDGLAYNGGNGVSYAGFVNGEGASVLGGSLSYGGTAQGAVNAGSYSLTASGLASNNYAIAYEPGALTVAQAALTVTANNAAKTYDGLAYNGGNGVSYAGFVNGEGASVLGGSLSYGGTAQGAVIRVLQPHRFGPGLEQLRDRLPAGRVDRRPGGFDGDRQQRGQDL